MFVATFLFLALFTIALTRGTMDGPDFFDNYIKSVGDDCTNEDCIKKKYVEPVSNWNDFSQSYQDLSNYIPHLNQENKRNDAVQMDILSKCDCHSTTQLHDLGHSSYPRYIYTSVCLTPESKQQKCWTGTKCSNIKYYIPILRNRTPFEKQDERIPESLRNNWMSQYKEISVGCQCSIK